MRSGEWSSFYPRSVNRVVLSQFLGVVGAPELRDVLFERVPRIREQVVVGHDVVDRRLWAPDPKASRSAAIGCLGTPKPPPLVCRGWRERGSERLDSGRRDRRSTVEQTHTTHRTVIPTVRKREHGDSLRVADDPVDRLKTVKTGGYTSKGLTRRCRRAGDRRRRRVGQTASNSCGGRTGRQTRLLRVPGTPSVLMCERDATR